MTQCLGFPRHSNSSAGRASKRVFLLGDVELCNNWGAATNRNVHTGQQVVTKQVVKAEFMLGLANLMVQTLGSGQAPHVQQMIAEIIENLEVTKACLRAAEADARLDQWGVMCPAQFPLMSARGLFIRSYPRMAEILHMLGSSSLMALPTEADLSGPLALTSTGTWGRTRPQQRSACGCSASPGTPVAAPSPPGRCCMSAGSVAIASAMPSSWRTSTIGSQ